ncbi:calcium-activated chloride channel regulator 1 [Anolis carolinensis]|uniref:calcium-activated chloride channel regulator 1 n=1 Tax=Anolis carolinensis TaxID=28377 RepID=UPI002F2B5A53
MALQWQLVMVVLLLHEVKGTQVKLNNGGFEDIVLAINPGLSENPKMVDNIKVRLLNAFPIKVEYLLDPEVFHILDSFPSLEKCMYINEISERSDPNQNMKFIYDMVEEASSYLFNATKQIFYFKTVKVVIPITWTPKPEYRRVTKESYEKVSEMHCCCADVIVADPFVKYGDEPYTLQYGGCGEKGRYIHFTPKFMTNDNLISVYGSRGNTSYLNICLRVVEFAVLLLLFFTGRVFVHEWAHLRWGLFDEYNNDAPFYSVGNNKAEATRYKPNSVYLNETKVFEFYDLALLESLGPKVYLSILSICSSDFTGKYIFRTNEGQIRACNIEHHTQLFEVGCEFIPEKTQTTPASIMYMQSLSSVSRINITCSYNLDLLFLYFIQVTQFCDESNHNIKAPNMQNKMCNYRSTWDVIMDSTDFASSSPRSAPPPRPTISLLQTQDRVLCLVLDISGSMNGFDRIYRLRQAGEQFLLQILETGSWAGIVVFNSQALTKTYLKQITGDSVRQTLSAYLPTAAGGGTNICSGIREGFQVFLKKYPSTEGCEIVLLTDGEDAGVSSCFAEVQRSGSIIHTIALGPSAAKELEMLADMTGGLKFSATDSLDSNGLIDAFSGISSGSGDISQQSIQLESKGRQLDRNKWMYGFVSIDKTVGNDTSFVVTWSDSTYPPRIDLSDPKRKTYTQTDFVIDNTNIRTARLKIPGTAEISGSCRPKHLGTHRLRTTDIDGWLNYKDYSYSNKWLCHCCLNSTTASTFREKLFISRSSICINFYFYIFQTGDWTYRILNTHTEVQGVSITVTSRAASATVPPVVVKSYLNRESNMYPNPVVIYAEVSQGFMPVIGANVTAIIESASGKSVQLQLLDDGAGPDILKHDGIYSRYFTFNDNGRYSIKIYAQGKDETVRRARRQSQALYVTGYVENGEIKLNPPRPHPREDEIQANVGNFSRTASGGSFVTTGVPPGNPPDVFPPCKITDLEVELSKDKEFLLSWTAPGNDYDMGKAERYEIRMSENPLELRDATFHNATSLNTSGLIPEFAGVKQSFLYNPENLQRENATSIYFAIRAIDENDNVGETSNIAGVVLLPDNTSPNSSSDKHMPPCIVKATLLLFLIMKTVTLAP